MAEDPDRLDQSRQQLFGRIVALETALDLVLPPVYVGEDALTE